MSSTFSLSLLLKKACIWTFDKKLGKLHLNQQRRAELLCMYIKAYSPQDKQFNQKNWKGEFVTGCSSAIIKLGGGDERNNQSLWNRILAHSTLHTHLPFFAAAASGIFLIIQQQYLFRLLHLLMHLAQAVANNKISPTAV